MPVPSAVQARALAARQALSGAPQGAPDPEPVPNSTPSEPAAPRPGMTPGGNVLESDPNASVTPAAPEAPAKAPDGATPGYIDPSDHEARYKALRASRNVDRERADAAEARVRQLEAQHASSQPQAQQGKENGQAQGFKLSDEERGYLGEEEAKVFEKVGQHVDQRLGDFEQRQQAEATRSHQDFLADLDSLAPGWRALNDAPELATWLAQADEFGMTRKAILDHQVASRDAEGAAKLFRAYSNQGQGAAPVAPTVSSRDGLSIDPTVSRSTADPEMMLVFSPQEYAGFFVEKTNAIKAKRYVGQVKADLDAREAELQQAWAEGRVF